MKNLFVAGMRAMAVGVALAGATLPADALTLGRIRGAAWIGQPLDLLVSVELDAGAAPGPICQEVEVFYADSRQDNARIRTVTEPTAQANVVNLRVISSALIDEPVVTVYLRAGCGQKTARRYVLLADYANEAATSPSRAVTPVAPPVPTVTIVEPTSPPVTNAPPPALAIAGSGSNASAPALQPATLPSPQTAAGTAPTRAPTATASANAANPSSTGSVTSTEISAAAPPKAPNPASTAPAASAAASAVQVAANAKPAPQAKSAPQVPAPKPEPKPKAPPKPQPPAKAVPAAKPPVAATAKADTGKARLKLDPLDTSAEKPAVPAPGIELPDPQATNDEASADAKRMEDLQASVKTLLDQSAKNEATLLALRERLERAETERVPMNVVYALAALLVLAMAGVVYLWNRRMNERALALQDDDNDEDGLDPPSPDNA